MKTVKEVKKVAIIKFYEDSGRKSWLIQESFDGEIPNKNSHDVLNREGFYELQSVIQDYLEKGFTIEISK